MGFPTPPLELRLRFANSAHLCLEDVLWMMIVQAANTAKDGFKEKVCLYLKLNRIS